MEKKKYARSILDKRERLRAIVTESYDPLDRIQCWGAVTRERDAQSFATVYHLPRATARKWGPNFARSIQGEAERTQNQYY
jgi:hypothetical protein